MVIGVRDGERQFVVSDLRVDQLAIVFGRQFGIVADMKIDLCLIVFYLLDFLLVVELGKILMSQHFFDAQPLGRVELQHASDQIQAAGTNLSPQHLILVAFLPHIQQLVNPLV